MGSRIRENVRHYFECFCEVVRPQERVDAWIIQKFPETYCDEEVLKSVPKFTYPCEFDNSVVQHFSFVLTSQDSKWTFGFCRHDPKSETALVVLSFLPWHESFTKFLNHISELTHGAQTDELWKFLDAVYQSKVPDPGASIQFPFNNGQSIFTCQSPSQFQLPSIPENRNLTEYYNAVEIDNMVIVFASMLFERRIIFTSKKLNRLSACVQSANAIIYPMSWQHIFIPVLPQQLVDYLLAPMPYLIGVSNTLLHRVRRHDMGEVVILDADKNEVETPFNDLESLPQDVVRNLKTQLRNKANLLGDGLSRAFLRALVQLIGGYRDALRFHQGEKITFNKEAFVESRPPSMQTFLRKMLDLQIFQQFIEERLDMLNAGLGFSDEFEMEACNYSDKTSSRLKHQYKEWTYTVKKEGSAFFKSVKSRVKERGKPIGKAYKGIRSKFKDTPSGSPDPMSETSLPRPPRPHTSFMPTASTTYRKDMKQRLSAGPDISRSHYSPLSPSSPENKSNFQLSPLDMDLMGDLQDVIFRNCSTLNDSPESPACDRSLKPVRSLEHFPPNSTLSVNPNLVSSPDLFGSSPFTINEEERNTGDNMRLIQSTENDFHLPPPKSASKNSSKMENRDLIRLDSISSVEDFDPLCFRDVEQIERPQLSRGLSLTNPLYPYFTPTYMSQSQEPVTTRRDLDLLKEYGLDFNSLSVHSSPPRTAVEFPSLSTTPANTQRKLNWTTFD